MTLMTFSEAIRAAIHEEMRIDSRVFVMGQDVELFLMSAESRRNIGRERVRSTPISELAFIGAGIGAALTGLRPIIELGCSTFLYSAMDQIVNQAAKSRYMFGGQASVPIVIRAPVLYTIAAAAHHSDRPWGLFAQAPGLKIVVPTTPYEAKGLLKSAIRDGNPVIFFEDVGLASREGEVPDVDYSIPIGTSHIKRAGDDITIVAIAGAVHLSLAAALKLDEEDISAEVIDVRTVVPLDHETIFNSVTKTGRLLVVDPAPRMCSVAAEIAALVAEVAFSSLKEPICRLCAPNVPVPFAPELEKRLYPTIDSILATARKQCNRRDSTLSPRRTA